MTHENFLAMLKGQKEDAKVMEEFEAVTSKGKPLTNNNKLPREKVSGSSSTGASGSAGPVTWNALLDDYPLAGQSMALKVRTTLTVTPTSSHGLRNLSCLETLNAATVCSYLLVSVFGPLTSP